MNIAAIRSLAFVVQIILTMVGVAIAVKIFVEHGYSSSFSSPENALFALSCILFAYVGVLHTVITVIERRMISNRKISERLERISQSFAAG
jgi:hypothetical protein